ncbi:MAG: hypothetical protein H6606_01905 [Flavobacteriales bacterium]|nr:hypothetical protein [Flavobacteriales bacterium]
MNTTDQETNNQLPDLSFLRAELSESFTNSVLDAIEKAPQPGKTERIMRITARSLYWAAAASIVLLLGIAIQESGSLSMDNLLGLGSYSELEIYQYLDSNTYDY